MPPAAAHQPMEARLASGLHIEDKWSCQHPAPPMFLPPCRTSWHLGLRFLYTLRDFACPFTTAQTFDQNCSSPVNEERTIVWSRWERPMDRNTAFPSLAFFPVMLRTKNGSSMNRRDAETQREWRARRLSLSAGWRRRLDSKSQPSRDFTHGVCIQSCRTTLSRPHWTVKPPLSP